MARRGRRFWIAGLILVLLLGGLAYADRWAAGRVEQQVAGLLQTELGLTEKPTVAIDGFPFLTQVATNTFGHVELQGRGLPAGTTERPLTVDQLQLDLRQVRTSDRFHRITAGTLSGSAGVTWAEISAQAGQPVTPEDDGRVRVDITANLYGQRVPFVVSARPVLEVETQQVRLSEPRIVVAAYRIPDEVVERIAREMVPPIELSLPLGLAANDLKVGPTHLELGLAGTDVLLVE